MIAFGGGTAYATHLVVDSSDIVDGQVMTADLADSAVIGSKVATSSLFGTDPKASNVNGVKILPIEFLAPSSTAARVILNSGAGVKLSARCSSTGSDATEIDNERAFENFTSSNSYELVRDDDGDQSGQASYMTSGGDVVTIIWAADNNTSNTFTKQCAFFGTAFIH